MTTVGAGQVAITARLGNLTAVGPNNVFTVAPGIPAEHMLRLSVIASDLAGQRVPDVAVEVLPERGPRQTGHTSAAGSCSFYVFRTAIQVRGTKSGDEPVEAAAVNPYPTDSFSRRANLTMRPQ